MSLTGVIAGFASGTYTVTRTAAGTLTTGRYTAGATSSFSIVATIQPMTGRNLKILPEGQHAEETMVVYTTTELRARTPASEPDVFTFDGEAWKVVNVKRWQAFGDTHYVATIGRTVTP
jgi:hypothetical protein